MIFKDVYPYRYVTAERTRTVKGREYHIFAYGAYDAFGLIGPEHNGIAIGCVTDGALVLDDHYRQSNGWYPGFENTSAMHRASMEVTRLATLPAVAFLAFIRQHPSWRGVSA